MKPSIFENPLNCDSRRQGMSRGFTLVEVLIVISIIAVLALVVTSIAKKVRGSASSAVCVNQMKQIGNALLMFTQENQGRLPTSPSSGAPFVGQGPWYNRDDRNLQNHIGQYLGSPESTTWSNNASQMTYDPSFAWPALLSNGQPGSKSIVLCTSVQIKGANGAVSTGSPWAGSKPPGGAYVGRKLDDIEDPRSQQAFTEVDQKNTNAGWKNLVPPGPIHGTYRNTLFFDLHVDRVPVTP
ncbi:MAG: type II secretion system protein [Luteolibacter sp.]